MFTRNMGRVLVSAFLIAFYLYSVNGQKEKVPKPSTQIKQSAKYDNPDQIRDRQRDLAEKAHKGYGYADNKPKITTTQASANKSTSGVGKTGGVFRPSVMGDKWSNRFKQAFHPTFMDYCDPRHCGAYHKLACGLNRNTMRFKWFQSGCHIILHNICYNYRDGRKYDHIEAKHCSRYVMFVRSTCPPYCTEQLAPVCGMSSYDNHVVLFKNECFFEKANCHPENFNEYDAVDMNICRNTLAYESLRKG